MPKSYSVLKDCFTEGVVEVGIDEAGRGSLIGRVYAGAVILPREDEIDEDELHIYRQIKDSKKINREKREFLKDYIESIAIDCAVGYSDNNVVDNVNILNATYKAMHNALDKLNVEPENLLVDGHKFSPYQHDNGEYIPHVCITSGDAKYRSIAAASILAKVYHDFHIRDLVKEYPKLDDNYHLTSNMGYGTSDHIDGILKYGISQFHRKSFNICGQAKLFTYDQQLS